jgi:hypothetical protein
MPQSATGKIVADDLVRANWLHMTKPSKTHCCACHLDDSAATVVHNVLQLKENGMAKTQAMLAASQQPDSCKRTRKDGMRSRKPQAWAERAVDAKEVLLLAQTKRREEALEAKRNSQAATSSSNKQQQPLMHMFKASS